MFLNSRHLCVLRRVANLSCIKDFGQAAPAAPPATAAAAAPSAGGGGRTWERGKQDSPPPADDPNAIVLGPEKVVSCFFY